MIPALAFILWLTTGKFDGYDFRNCEIVPVYSEVMPSFIGIGVVECWGPPLPPPEDTSAGGSGQRRDSGPSPLANIRVRRR